MFEYLLDLKFIFFFLLTMSMYDIWKMAKSEFLYWGYNPQHEGKLNPQASDAASISQFAWWYTNIFAASAVLYNLHYYAASTAIANIIALLWLHWTGNEDLFYFLFSKIIKLPKEYIETHPTFKLLVFDIPVKLPWLSNPRKVWFFSIPSIMGLVLGKDVPGKWFVTFALTNLAIITAIAYIFFKF